MGLESSKGDYTDLNMVPRATRSSVVSTFFALVLAQGRAYGRAGNITSACVCPVADAKPAAWQADSDHPEWPVGQSATEMTAAFTKNTCPSSPPDPLRTSLTLGNGTAPSLTNATRTVQTITLTISVGQTTILDLAMPVLLVVLLPRAHHPTKNHHAMDPNDRHDSGHLHQVFGQDDLSEIPGPADDRGVETTSASFILCL